MTTERFSLDRDALTAELQALDEARPRARVGGIALSKPGSSIEQTSINTHTAPTDTLEHLVCCEAEDGTLARTHCGALDLVDGTVADEVSCVVCNDLDANDWCPIRGRCPYGKDWTP